MEDVHLHSLAKEETERSLSLNFKPWKFLDF